MSSIRPPGKSIANKLMLAAAFALAAASAPVVGSTPGYGRQTPGAGVKPNPNRAKRRAANKAARKARKQGRK